MGASDVFPLDPDYPIRPRKLSGVVEQQVDTGEIIGRLKRPDLRIFDLNFGHLSTDQMEQLRDWWERFKNDYFIFNHKAWVNNAGSPLARKFPVRWFAPLEESLFMNDTYAGPVQLIEAARQAMQAGDYPDPTAGHPSFFIQEDHASLAKTVSGIWTLAAHANAKSGQERTSPNNNATDKFRFTYAGYGFRYWARKGPDLGKAIVALDGVNLTTLDFYAAAGAAAAALVTKLDVPLGVHWVDVIATNSKNLSSSALTIPADAIEVMP